MTFPAVRRHDFGMKIPTPILNGSQLELADQIV